MRAGRNASPEFPSGSHAERHEPAQGALRLRDGLERALQLLARERRKLTRIDPVGIGAGARFRVNAPLRKVWMDTAIVAVEEPFQIVEEGEGGRNNRIPTHTVWELKEGPGSLTSVRLSHWTEPAAVDRGLELLSAGSVWQERGWREALRRLRDNLESDQPAAERIAVAGGNRYATGIP